MSKFWSQNLNNAPVMGYETRSHQYVSERGNKPEPAALENPVSRQQRRMAAKILRKRDMLATSEENETSRERRLGNSELPIANMRHEIIDSIANNQVTIVVAETGAGKSTQVMQYIIDDLDRDVTLTQPRRIAARNIANRVTQEVSEARPGTPNIIGYHTAETNTVTEHTRGTVCTDGLRYVKQLHDSGTLENEILCIDEVHEWNTNIEMLVGWTRELIKTNPDMRVVLMSATVDASSIANFYADVTETVPPIIEVPGRTFHVEKHEKPTSTIVEELTSLEAAGKNILCFLPGKTEIKNAIEQTKRSLEHKGHTKLPELIPLHSKLSEKEQDRSFRSYPNGKIVFATNVAQTSLTIDDIDMVVDSGLVRAKQIDDEGIGSLVVGITSQDDCDQRAGRAGRVKEGVYVLTRLDASAEFVPYIARDKHPVPEIYRTDVDSNTLRFASIGLDLAGIKLKNNIDHVPIERSKRSLRLLGALDEDNNITSIGRRMEKMSAHPMFARMIVESEQYSASTRAQVIAMATACDVGGLKLYAPDVKKRWKDLIEEKDSDAIAQLELFIAARGMTPWQQQQHDLDVKNVQRAQEQYEKIMRRASFDPDLLTPPNPQERENIKRCIYAGMIDHIYEYAGSDEYTRIDGGSKTHREISNRSVVRGKPPLVAATPYRVEFYQNGDKVEKHIIENVTKVTTPSVLAEVALHLCSWETDTQTLRGGRLMNVDSLSFRGVSTGVTREAPAIVSNETQQFMVDHVMNNPGSALRELYAVESQIKALQKLSTHAPKSIHTLIRSIVAEAVAEGGLEESYIDHLIRQDAPSLSDYISSEEIDAIYRNAPQSITRYGHDFTLSYESGVPLVKKYDIDTVLSLPGEVALADGRTIKFVGERGKRFTISKLRQQYAG